MTEQMILVKYQCQHTSCQVNCKSGELMLDESYFNELSDVYEEKELFRSPRGVCRMGFNQPFKVVSISEIVEGDAEVMTEAEENAAILHKTTDPIEILKEEHNTVLKNLDRIEAQIQRRDVEGLWTTVADVENEIILHSILKEEEVLFPLIAAMPLGEGLTAIMMEDHRELLSLLNSLRTGLRKGDIFDGIAHSMVANLRSHIQKENGEFFDMVDNYLDSEGKVKLFEGMAKIQKVFVATPPGERCELAYDENDAEVLKRNLIEESILSIKDQLSNQCGSCH